MTGRFWPWLCVAAGLLLLLLGGNFSLAEALGYTLVVLGALVVLFRATRWFLGKLFFRVRNRIIINYLLTSILPLLFILLLLIIAFHFFMVQLVSTEFRQVMSHEQTNMRLLAGRILLRAVHVAGTADLGPHITPLIEPFPGLEVRLLQPATGELLWSNQGAATSFPWTDDAVETGYFPRNGHPVLATRKTWQTMQVQLVQPLSGEYAQRVGECMLGDVDFKAMKEAEQANATFSIDGRGFHLSYSEADQQDKHAGKEDAAHEQTNIRTENSAHGIAGFSSYFIGPMASPKEPGKQGDIVLGIVHTTYLQHLERILQGAFPKEAHLANIFLIALSIIAAVFIFIEVIALVFSLYLSRSITKLIARLHKKAKYLAKGDFSYRINSKRKDQLGQLAQTFDSLSDQLQGLLDQARQNERLKNEVQIAQKVQQAFFPSSLPEGNTFSILGHCLPAAQVSGDFYNTIEQDGTVDLMVGDISGKGISAALLMASSQTFLALQASHRPMLEVADIASHFNHYFRENSAADQFCTLFYGRFDARANTITYCNAGHLPPYRIHENKVEHLPGHDVAIGLLAEPTFTAHRAVLHPGDLLVVLTDGYTEVFGKHKEMLGEEAIMELLRNYRGEELPAIHKQLLDTISQWRGNVESTDDMTVLMFRIKPSTLL